MTLRSRAISTVGTAIFTDIFPIGGPPIPSTAAHGQSSTASASTGTRRAGRITSIRAEFPRARTTTESRHSDRSPISLWGDRGNVHKRSTRLHWVRSLPHIRSDACSRWRRVLPCDQGLHEPRWRWGWAEATGTRWFPSFRARTTARSRLEFGYSAT